eukprot:jgi/Undpi1/2792/HiC_scaffold_14.g06169.m1
MSRRGGGGRGGAAITPRTILKSPRRHFFAVGAATAAAALACTSLLPRRGDAQPSKYMHGAAWKAFLGGSGGKAPSWFERWNAMVQPRIDELAAMAESEGRESGAGGDPFTVTMVGDSTMMQQHGVMCAFLGERPGRRFDPKKNQEKCCVDTLPREISGDGGGNHAKPTLTNNGGKRTGEEAVGGRGLCFRYVFQRFAEHPGEEQLGAADAVYFGSGLHFLHMCRRGHGLDPPRVKGWLNYERNLEQAVEAYRSGGGEKFRLVFMTSHTVEESKYEGEFLDLVVAYRNNDTDIIGECERQGPVGYERHTYCRQALMDRGGSEVLNRRSRPVMANLGVPLVEGDLIVKDQRWATGKQDGRHYHMLVPTEVWEFLGVLVSPYAHAAQKRVL